MPTIMPITVRAVMRWPIQSADTMAVAIGVAALRSAPMPVGSVSDPYAIRLNGMAEKVMPTTTNAIGCARKVGQARLPKRASRTIAARPMRTSAAHSGPTCGAATRMNRKEPPQTAPRKAKMARSDAETRGVVGLMGQA